MTTRHFTRHQLEQIGVPPAAPDEIQYYDHLLADEHVATLKYTAQRRCVFTADDGHTYAVEYEAPLDTGDYEVGDYAPDDYGWHGDTIEATQMKQRPVVTRQWLPLDAPCDPGLDLLLPAWEAMYEPGNVSGYLIGYTNDECAAKAAAEAWLKSQAEVTGRLNWVPEERLATGDYDAWFELVERHADGFDTGPGLIVRHRTQHPTP